MIPHTYELKKEGRKILHPTLIIYVYPNFGKRFLVLV